MGDKSKKEKKQSACILCTVVLLGIIILLLILYFSLFQPRDPKVQIPTMQLLSLAQVGGSGASGAGASGASGGMIQSVALNLQVSMYNPNRADFFVDAGSTACLYYNDQQVGFTAIPPTAIPAQSFSTASIALSSNTPFNFVPYSSPYSSSSSSSNSNNGYYFPNTATPGPSSSSSSSSSSNGFSYYNPALLHQQFQLLPLNTSVTIIGHVTTGSIFSHHSDLISKCRISVALNNAVRPFIQSYTCEHSYSLDDE